MEPRKLLLPCLLLAVLTAVAVSADEGMWTYNNFPTRLVAERYGYTPSNDWLQHLQLSSVRFNNGGSGSFAGPNGLVLTNHHVGLDCVQQLGSAEHDYVTQGFYAPAHKDELKCPDLELNVVVGIEDVTDEVNAKVTPDMDAAARNAAQRAARTSIEQSCAEETGLRCDVVVLYEGGLFDLYRYKKYTDVRLVFAPETAVAFYGGDPDNFTYPRYCMDFAFFRVYENDQPVKSEHYLRWNPQGVKEGDVVFVSGNPGSTGRQLSLAQLRFLRDVQYPWTLRKLEERLVALRQYAARGEEERRIARDTIFTYENSLKAYTGYQSGLTDPAVMARKEATEQQLREQIAADPATQQKYGSVWEALAKAQKTYTDFFLTYSLLERGIGLDQVRLFELARMLVRLPAETAKANEKRLREFRDSNLDSLKQDLFSEAPLYPAYEKVFLAQLLTELQENLGADDPSVKKILAGRTPKEAAAAYVDGSSLASADARRALADGGQAAVDASADSMIQLAQLVDERARQLRKRYEDEVQAVERQNGSLLAQALFALQGTTTYPEATFTLRLSFGAVKGYFEKGLPRRWYTTLHGLYEREAGIPPYQLPQRWLEGKKALALDTPFNFVSTNDITGGNSGSPVVNRRGEFVGIIFDGNIQSLPNQFLYTDEVARSVSVHAAAIVEALGKVYGANSLLRELSLPAKE
jgi:hypothetical protein